MGKKKSWFTYVKRLFIHESKPKPKEKPKKWRWCLEMFKFEKYPALEVPQRVLDDATEAQRKRSMAVAIATAAAAEAAVAAAKAAAEVVRLTNIPSEHERRNLKFAAIKIQSAYRGHLARKALGALKGLVKLQAVIRAELVRRRIVKALAPMSTFTKARSQVHQKRVPTLLDYLNHGEKRLSLSQREGTKSEEFKLQFKTPKSWDMSLVSKEDMEAVYLQKQEAIAKRERMKQYSSSYRERRNNQSPQETMPQQEEKQKLNLLTHSNTITVEPSWLRQLKLRTACKQEMIEELTSSPFSLPRRSFCHVKQKTSGEGGSLTNSPVFPTYMASTESAKAKSSRSLSTPKQRLRLCETYSGDQHSPYKLRLSWSSFNEI